MSIQDELPRSRINLKYRTTIDGIEQTIELPFRILLLGDLSLGSSGDRKTDFDSRRMRSLDGKNLDSIMEDMKMSIRFQVKNRIDPGKEEQLTVDMPIHNRRSFLPEEVAHNIPKINSLLMIRRLLIEMLSNIDNRREVRRVIHELFQQPEQLKALRDALEPYSGYRLPDPNATPVKRDDA